MFLALAARPRHHRRPCSLCDKGITRAWRATRVRARRQASAGSPRSRIAGMPLTEFQKSVARVIAPNRTPESHIAGRAALNRGDAGLRISDDLDIFNDALTIRQNTAEFVSACVDADERLTKEAG